VAPLCTSQIPLCALLLGGLTLACNGDDTGSTDGSTTTNSTASSSGSSSSGSAGSSAGESGGDDSLAQACVDEINDYRASLSLPPYTRWTDAEGCTDDEAKSDSQSGTPHGAFPSCNESAQNECPGWPSTDLKMSLLGCLSQMWAEGPGEDFQKHGHYINMSSTKYTKVACGFYTTPEGSLWAIQNFK